MELQWWNGRCWCWRTSTPAPAPSADLAPDGEHKLWANNSLLAIACSCSFLSLLPIFVSCWHLPLIIAPTDNGEKIRRKFSSVLSSFRFLFISLSFFVSHLKMLLFFENNCHCSDTESSAVFVICNFSKNQPGKNKMFFVVWKRRPFPLHSLVLIGWQRFPFQLAKKSFTSLSVPTTATVCCLLIL